MNQKTDSDYLPDWHIFSNLVMLQKDWGRQSAEHDEAKLTPRVSDLNTNFSRRGISEDIMETHTPSFCLHFSAGD